MKVSKGIAKNLMTYLKEYYCDDFPSSQILRRTSCKRPSSCASSLSYSPELIEVGNDDVGEEELDIEEKEYCRFSSRGIQRVGDDSLIHCSCLPFPCC